MNGENPTSLQQIEALAKSEQVRECTYSQGYIDQVVFACLTCYQEQRQLIPQARKKELVEKYGEPTDPAALCIGCSIRCHENHDIFLLHRKGAVRCDCGNSKFLKPCTLCAEKDYENDQNTYDHNYFNRFCHCDQEYEDESEAMLQCELCFDWFHISHACLQDDQESAVKSNTKRDDREDSGKSISINPLHNFYINIERAVYICKKCLQTKCPFFLPYLSLWKFLSKQQLTMDDLRFSYQTQVTKRGQLSQSSEHKVQDKEENICIFECLKSKRETSQIPVSQGKQTAFAREQQMAEIIEQKKEEQCEEQEKEQKEKKETKDQDQIENKEEKKEECENAMLVSLESQDYCKCKTCWAQIEPIVEQLQKKQEIGGKCLLEFQPSQLEIPTPLLPVAQEKMTEEGINQQVGQLFRSITDNFENKNTNVPHKIKIYAAEQFKKFFDKFKVFLQKKDDSVVTEKDVQRFLQEIGNEDASLQKALNREEDSDEGGDKRREQEGQ